MAQTASRAISNRNAAHRANADRFASALRIFSNTLNGPQFTYDAEGRKVRVWTDLDSCLAPDVINWLRGLRFVEDLADGLEFVKQSTIDRLVRDGHLVKAKIGGGYYVSAKCAKHYGLDKFMFKGNKWLA